MAECHSGATESMPSKEPHLSIGASAEHPLGVQDEKPKRKTLNETHLPRKKQCPSPGAGAADAGVITIDSDSSCSASGSKGAGPSVCAPVDPPTTTCIAREPLCRSTEAALQGDNVAPIQQPTGIRTMAVSTHPKEAYMAAGLGQALDKGRDLAGRQGPPCPDRKQNPQGKTPSSVDQPRLCAAARDLQQQQDKSPAAAANRLANVTGQESLTLELARVAGSVHPPAHGLSEFAPFSLPTPAPGATRAAAHPPLASSDQSREASMRWLERRGLVLREMRLTATLLKNLGMTSKSEELITRASALMGKLGSTKEGEGEECHERWKEDWLKITRKNMEEFRQHAIFLLDMGKIEETKEHLETLIMMIGREETALLTMATTSCTTLEGGPSVHG